MSRQTTTCASHPSKPPANHRLRLRLRSAVRRIGLLGTASLLALVLPWSAARADIVIGQVAPLSGVLASTGKQMVLGGSIYFRHVNAQGGVHGQKIAVKVLDDGYKVDDTVRLTRELLADPELVALFGFAGTSNVGKLLSEGVLEQGGAALVAPYTGGEPLRNPFNPWIFHVRAGYADETEHMVQQVTTLGMTRIAVMYQDDGFGKAGLEGVRKALTRRKLELSAAAPYDRNTDNVDAAVQQIMKSDAQAIIMIAVNKPSSAFIKRYREAGGGAQLYNISVVDPAEIVKLADLKNAHGLGISQVVPFPYQPNLPVVREYQTLLKKYAPDEHINYTSFEEFLGAKVLVEGLRRAGPAPTRARVIKALESLGHYDLGGVTVNYSPDNRVGSRYVEVTVIGRTGRLMK
ncbi:MAG: ABC transporter substrate-binding protein [Burkholderiaceae bacterium]|nr:ABC transporter substrate-binding protein [Burkholderiaceae bacterium]